MRTTAEALITQLIESPQNLPDDDFDLSLDRHNREVAAKLRVNRKRVANLNGHQVYVSSNPTTELDTYFTVAGSGEQEHLTFMATVTDLDVQPLGLGSVQVALWRGHDYVPTLPRLVFWQVLMKRHNLMISDSGHTRSGKIFWRDRLLEAVSRGLRCGLVDEATNRLTEFHSADDVANARATAYGDTAEYGYRRFFIEA